VIPEDHYGVSRLPEVVIYAVEGISRQRNECRWLIVALQRIFCDGIEKAVDYMIEPIHCCKHSMKIALVFQGYPESLFVSWKAFDDKEVNRPAFCCVAARFS
jgi:hypothetical protein